MRSATIFASVLAFAASAFAQDSTPGYAVVSAPGKGDIVPSGKTYAIKWSAGKFKGPATISLLGGSSPTTLAILDSIAASVDVKDETFSWPVACSLGELKTYGIKIADEASNGATFQYSFPFEIKGPSCASASSSSSSSATESSTTSASATGYPTKGSSVTSYPTETSTSVVKPSTTTSSSASYIVSSIYTTTSVKSYPTVSITPTTLTTYTAPVVTVTQTHAASGNGSASYPTASTTATPLPTAGAARMGAGLALGLLAAALAL
ncbi:Ser-Thr-rich glycosyl-phosphatidyl-inositol-anchored membrane family-domain-containing protein [Nemania serpens]|nr:Ser-Thr-rich glycosyl-phosphatidyl-inositol-anchored membrane family-domain-containing protein [Nemania serpens]